MPSLCRNSLPAQVETGRSKEIQANPVNVLPGLLGWLHGDGLVILCSILQRSGQPEPQFAFHAAAQIACLKLECVGSYLQSRDLGPLGNVQGIPDQAGRVIGLADSQQSATVRRESAQGSSLSHHRLLNRRAPSGEPDDQENTHHPTIHRESDRRGPP